MNLGFFVELTWNDFKTLKETGTFVTRYDGQNKVTVHKIAPLDKDWNNYEESHKTTEYATFSAVSSDFDVYIPEAAFRDSRISAFRFKTDYGNVEVKEKEEVNFNIDFRIKFPGSVQVVDMKQFYYDD